MGRKECRSGRGMCRLVTLVSACAVLFELSTLAFSAPAKIKDQLTEESHLIRTKRAEEISFGNHQYENTANAEHASSALNNDVAAVHDLRKRSEDNVVTEEDASNKQEVKGNVESGKERTEEKGEKEGDSQVDEGTDEKRVVAPNEMKFEAPPSGTDDGNDEGIAPDDSKITASQMYEDGDDNSEDEVINPSEYNDIRKESLKPTDFLPNDDVNDDDLGLEGYHRKRRSATSSGDVITGRRLKRDTSHDQSLLSLTADTMGSAPLAAGSRRSRRDLGYDELRDILSAQKGDDDGTEDSDDESEQEAFLPEGEQEKEEEVESSEEAAAIAQDLANEEQEAQVEDEIVRSRYELVKTLLKEKEKQEVKEAVLSYLLSAAEARAQEAELAREETEREMERDAALLSYHERLDAPVSKRYPYQSYPYTWSALLPGQKRSYRVGDEEDQEDDEDEAEKAAVYERLYRLAQALNDNEAAEGRYRDEKEEEDVRRRK